VNETRRWGLDDGRADGRESECQWWNFDLELSPTCGRYDVARAIRIVLHDVNRPFARGARAILGPNGCGKSTLILTMTCQIYPWYGPGMQVPDLRARALGI